MSSHADRRAKATLSVAEQSPHEEVMVDLTVFAVVKGSWARERFDEAATLSWPKDWVWGCMFFVHTGTTNCG